MVYYKVDQKNLAKGRLRNILKTLKDKNKKKDTILIVNNVKNNKTKKQSKEYKKKKEKNKYIFENKKDYTITTESMKHQHFPPFDVGFHWTTNILYHV